MSSMTSCDIAHDVMKLRNITLILSCSCDCQSGFEGDRCETNIDDCVSHACQNNATCNDLVNMYECVCPTGYTGLSHGFRACINTNSIGSMYNTVGCPTRLAQ